MIILIQRCKLSLIRLSLRLLMVFLFLFSTAQLQSQSADSNLNIDAYISADYYDIFRQSAERSKTTLQAHSFDAIFSISKGCDTLTLAYTRWSQYASYNNFRSVISTSAENRSSSASIRWTSSIGRFDYSCRIHFPSSYTLFPLYYDAWIRLKYFGEIFAPEFSYMRLPASFSSGLGLKDFSFILNEHSTSSAWNATLRSRPIEIAEGSIAYGKRITKIIGKTIDYSSPSDWNDFTCSAHLLFYPKKQSSFWMGWEKNRGEGKEILNKDNLEFGDLAYGELNFEKWSIGGRINIFSMPFKCEYIFRKYDVYGAGHIESWPFTPLASTVFDNRLYYRAFGSVEIDQIESNISIKNNKWSIEPSLGLISILPDLVLKHWEPDFLVFGVKNVADARFSIRRCWLLRIGCQIDFPIFGLKTTINMEQFIPLSVIYYNEQASSTPDSTAPSVPGAGTSTDGGRRIKLQLSLP